MTLPKKEAKIKIFEYIKAYYNKRRIHSTLGWCSPEEYLENYYNNTVRREEKTQQVEQKEAV